MSLKCLQEAMKLAYYDRDEERGVHATFTWLVEEVGELAEALLNGDKRRVGEEVADIIAWTLSIANLMDVDALEHFKEKYAEDLKRAGCLSKS